MRTISDYMLLLWVRPHWWSRPFLIVRRNQPGKCPFSRVQVISSFLDCCGQMKMKTLTLCDDVRGWGGRADICSCSGSNSTLYSGGFGNPGSASFSYSSSCPWRGIRCPITGIVPKTGSRSGWAGITVPCAEAPGSGKGLGVTRSGFQAQCAFSWQGDVGQVVEHLHLFSGL